LMNMWQPRHRTSQTWPWRRRMRDCKLYCNFALLSSLLVIARCWHSREQINIISWEAKSEDKAAANGQPIRLGFCRNIQRGF
jgi:hypothetical protein